MRWYQMLIFLVSMGLSASVFAEFYQYVDENGAIRFTDSYVDIPVNQRPQVKRFAEPDDELTPEQIAERERIQREQAGKTPTEIKAEERLKLRESLNQRKAELDQRTAKLQKEKESLEKEKETVLMSNFAQAKAYRSKVINFNRRLVEHQQQLKVFNEKVEVFNREEQSAKK